jgi:diazepam-binding inhibitor (GABA receptor modulating acyl-CoA-binding protein)
MSEQLEVKFQQASQDVVKLPKAPDNDVKLQLYALYKQGSTGDCAGDRPGMLDFVGRVKYDCWKKLAGTSKEAAMQQYIDLVEKLKSGA